MARKTLNLPNEVLISMAKEHKTFQSLLKDRKLYYKLHNRGILKEATMNLKRLRPRYTVGVVDLKKLISTIYKYDSYTEFGVRDQSAYIILRRHGIDTYELFENKDNIEYVKNVFKEFGERQLEKFIK